MPSPVGVSQEVAFGPPLVLRKTAVERLGISPAGGVGIVSPLGEFLLQRCKRNQKTAGGGSRAFDNALSRLSLPPLSRFARHLPLTGGVGPGPPICFTREPSRGGISPSGAGKGQDTVPRAARCRSVFLEQVLAPTRAIAPGVRPSRGGSVVALPPWRVLDAQRLL